MDFFNTDLIEGKIIEPITEKNINEMYNSMKVETKMKVLQYLDSPETSNNHFDIIMKACSYAIKDVKLEAFKLYLRWMPYSTPNPLQDEAGLNILITSIMPWVNETALLQEQESRETPPSISVEFLNNQICLCLELLAEERLDPRSINNAVVHALRNPNPKVRISGCQAVKHFYISVENKLLLELETIFSLLVDANSIGSSRELKKHSLECMMAMYLVFGENMNEILEKLNSEEKIEAVKFGASKLKLKDHQKKSHSSMNNQLMGSKSKKSLQGNNESGNFLTVPGRLSKPPLIKNPDSSQKSTLTRVGSRTQVMDQSSMMSPTITSFSTSPQPPTANPHIVFYFDEYANEPASDLLLHFDDRWVKKIQVITKDEAVIEELNFLQENIQSHYRIIFYPDVNIGFLKCLKNLLTNPNKRIEDTVIRVLHTLFKRTVKMLGKEGFLVFYEEIILRLKAKTKLDDLLLESLVFLSSNVSLANFLRRIEKSFQEKSSVLRINLITVVVTLLENKDNYEAQDIAAAGNALVSLKKYAEKELSKDANPGVRKYSEEIVRLVNEKYKSETDGLSMTGDHERSSVNEALSGRKSVGGASSYQRKSYKPLSTEKKMTPKERISERPASKTFGSGSGPILESIIHDRQSYNSRKTFTPTPKVQQNPVIKLSNLRDLQKESKLSRVDQSLQPKEVLNRSSYKSTGNLMESRPSVRNQAMNEIGHHMDFEKVIEILEKQNYERRDLLDSGKIIDIFSILNSKASSNSDIDRIITQLSRIKDDTDVSCLVNVLYNIYQTHGYFPSSLLPNYLPNILKISQASSRPSISPVFKSMIHNTKNIDDKEITYLIDCLVQYFGPVYFFTVFEEIMYSRELFGSNDAENLLHIFQSLIYKIPAEYHPVYLVLSVLRGFIYFHSSQKVFAMLGELRYIMLTVYGKDNFLYIKREFELVNIKHETVIDLAHWNKIMRYVNEESMNYMADISFKEKIISQVKDLTLEIRTFLNNPMKNEPNSLKEILQKFTRNFVYVIENKENNQLVDFLAEKILDSNILIQKSAMQAFLIHLNSASKVEFKFSQKFYNNMLVCLKHKNNEIRSIAIRTIYYITKNIDSKAFRLLQQGLSEPSDEVKSEILSSMIKLMEMKPQFAKIFDLAQGFQNLVSLIISKKQGIREDSERFMKLLLTHYEMKDFKYYTSKYPSSIQKELDFIFTKMLEKKKKVDPSSNLDDDMDERSGEGHNNFVIKRVGKIGQEVAKCKDVKQFKKFAQTHLSKDLFYALLEDVNSNNVINAVTSLGDGLNLNQNLAVKSFVFVVKMLNLLIAAETRRNEVSKHMYDLLKSQIKMRKNSSMVLAVEEKWVLVEFLKTVFETKFESKEIQSAVKAVSSLFPNPTEKSDLAKRVQTIDKNLYRTYMSNLKEFATESGTGESPKRNMKKQPERASIIKEQNRNRTSELKRKGTVDFDDYNPTVPFDDNASEGDPYFMNFQDAIADQSSIKYESESLNRGISESPRGAGIHQKLLGVNLMKSREINRRPSIQSSGDGDSSSNTKSNFRTVRNPNTNRDDDFIEPDHIFMTQKDSEKSPHRERLHSAYILPSTKPPIKPKVMGTHSIRSGFQNSPENFDLGKLKDKVMRRDHSGDIRMISTGDQKRSHDENESEKDHKRRFNIDSMEVSENIKTAGSFIFTQVSFPTLK